MRILSIGFGALIGAAIALTALPAEAAKGDGRFLGFGLKISKTVFPCKVASYDVVQCPKQNHKVSRVPSGGLKVGTMVRVQRNESHRWGIRNLTYKYVGAA